MVEVAKKDSKAAKKAAKVSTKKEPKAEPSEKGPKTESPEKGPKADPKAKAKRPRLVDDRDEMQRLEQESKELQHAQERNNRE